MRFFNTAGPIIAEDHYHVPPLQRLDRDELLKLIDWKRYFVLHAPRQTGKTSALLALNDELNGSGKYRCLYCNVEVAQSAREDVAAAMRAILNTIARQARLHLNDPFPDEARRGLLERAGPHDALREVLALWAAADAKPLVLLIDEIDALVGDTLIAVLRQLRAGYAERPRHFPQSVVLCGVRDVRDYRIRSSSRNEVITGGSPFNVKVTSLRLDDFSPDEVRALLLQHTAETGQRWTGEAIERVWELTQGQPWLVNALAYQACFDDPAGRDRSRPVTADAVRAAAERLIVRRDTHLDQLADKLREERVRNVIEPLLSGGGERGYSAADVEYVRDLGLIARGDPLRMANPIYAEVVPRELTSHVQASVVEDPAWYVDPDGGLNVARLLAAFREFFREHSEHWVQRFQYREAGPQLLLQAFLQRIVNSGGQIHREYGLGRMRTDLLIVWPAGAAPGTAGTAPGTARRTVIECKVVTAKQGMERTVRDGLEQTRAYLERCAAAEGHLVVFDRRPERTWEQKLFRRDETTGGAPVTVWGM